MRGIGHKEIRGGEASPWKQYISAIKDAAIKDHPNQKGKVKKLEDSKYVGDKEKEEVVVEGKHQQALWVNQ